ncbi:TPA: hypothetical protein SMP18_001471 [Proteus mirabilis]|nr:hypothetical protein [Proteus mirabilis]HEK0562233.1 hypothetical protein [Proteus mirabilis]
MKKTTQFLMKNIDNFLLQITKGIIKDISALFFWSLVFLSLPFVFYFINFHSGFSSNSADWGAFGSFIGGLLGPIVTLLTMIVLIANLYEARKTTIINKEIVETAKETAKMTKQKFENEDLNNKIQITINLIEKLSSDIKKQEYTYIDDIEWLSVGDDYNKALNKEKTYNFDNMCDIWGDFIFYSCLKEYAIAHFLEEKFDIDEKINTHMDMLRQNLSIDVPDAIALLYEIINLIKGIEAQNIELSSIPKRIFMSHINKKYRYWLYELYLKDSYGYNMEYDIGKLSDYIFLEWGQEFIQLPETILKTYQIEDNCRKSVAQEKEQ